MAFFDFLPVVSDVANGLSQYYTNKSNQEFAREQSNLAWSRSQEQWQRETLYNSFANQMYLLKQAGLNPNLAYDQSTDGASGQTPQMAASNSLAPQFNSPLMIAQVRNLNAQTAQLQASANKTMSEDKILGVQFQTALEEYNARVNPYADDDGTYWQQRTRMELQQFSSLLERAGLDEKNAQFLMSYMDNCGTSLEVEDLKLAQQRLQLTDLQMSELRANLSRLQMVSTMLEQFDNDVSKLPIQFQALARFIILYATNKAN